MLAPRHFPIIKSLHDARLLCGIPEGTQLRVGPDGCLWAFRPDLPPARVTEHGLVEVVPVWQVPAA